MSSWFGNSFTSLTDQITTFTKDVLNETTQEIEDPVTELQVAQKQVEQLKEEANQYTTELVRLRKSNEEYRERAETAEYQVVSNKEQYLKLLQEQEAEAEKLKEQLKEMKSQQRKIVMSTQSDSNLLSLQQKSQAPPTGLTPHATGIHVGVPGGSEAMEWSGGDWNEESDFEFLEVSQSQVSHLQSELARIKVECQHWKELAQQRDGNKRSDSELDHEVISNEDALHQERLRHEHEISTLQSLHAQQLQAMTLRHTKEIESLQEMRQQETKSGDELVMVGHVKQEALQVKNEEEEDNGELVGAAELSQLRLRNKQLMDKLQLNQVITVELREAITDLKELVHLSLGKQLKNMESEKRELTSYITDLQASFRLHQEIIDNLQAQKSQFEDETRSLSNELDSMNVKLENQELELNQATSKSERGDVLTIIEEDTMPQQLLYSGEDDDDVGVRIEEVDTHASEPGLNNKQQLERLQEMIKEREDRVDDLCSLLSKREEEIEALRREREDLSAQVTSLSANLSDVAFKLSEAVEHNERQEKAREGELMEEVAKRGDLEKQRLELEEKLRASERRSNQSSSDQSTLEDQLSRQNELIVQLTQERNDAIQSHNKLEQDHNQRMKESESVHLRETLDLQAKCTKQEKDLERLREHLLQVEEHYTGEAVMNKEQEGQLREQLRLMESELGRINEQLNQQSHKDHQAISQLQRDLAATIGERDLVKATLFETERERDQCAASLQNLQTVLEHFQKGGNELEELRRLLLKKQEEVDAANRECERLSSQCQQEEVSLPAPSVRDISDESSLKQKDDQIRSLSSEIESYKQTLKRFRAKIEELSCDQDTSVDKQLVRNLFLRYLSMQDDVKKRDKIIHVFGKILDINQEEINKVLGRKDSAWLSNILWPTVAPPSSPTTPTNEQVSLSRMFISFLESESTRPAQSKALPLLSMSPHPPPPKHLLALQAAPPKPKKGEELEESSAPPTSLEVLLEAGESLPSSLN